MDRNSHYHGAMSTNSETSYRNYYMFTTSGDRRITEVLNDFLANLDGEDLFHNNSSEIALMAIEWVCAEVAKTHVEVWDTVVREAIYDEVEAWYERQPHH